MPVEMLSAAFLQVPPFPGAISRSLSAPSPAQPDISDRELDELIQRIVALKVGGTYWGAQPELPDEPYTVIRLRDRRLRKEALELPGTAVSLPPNSALDPWYLLRGAAAVVVEPEDELAFLAAMAEVPVRCPGSGRGSGFQTGGRSAIRESFRAAAVQEIAYRNPFTGETIGVAAAIDLCGFWRRLIDSNRGLTGALGLARWKRGTVAPLLWGGTGSARFASPLRLFGPADRVAVWKSRTGRRTLERLEKSGAEILEVEDGFIRSVGLGAECIPPLSIIVDHLGIYFDPSRPSELEQLLQQGQFPEEMRARAADFRELVVQLGISKYGAGAGKLKRRAAKRHLLVVGQVEDDRAVMAGLGPRTNLKLLQQVRQANPDDYILYRPHPDVQAGHRAGAIADGVCLTVADEIIRDGSISSVIELADEVHVNTSLAGFEALLRGKTVTTYGVPFYAGWGLTRDLGPVPSRRSARRSIDELVAATLLLYPRYLDPVTGLPCPPETLVRRIGEGSASASPTPTVRLRRLQGRLKRSVAALWPDRK